MKDSLVQLARTLSGGTASETGHGLESAMEHRWPFSPSVTVLALLVAVIVTVVAYRREGIVSSWVRRPLILLRLLAISIVVVMMYGWTLIEHRTDLADLVVAVDASTSMTVIDRWGDEPWVKAMMRRLESTVDGPPSRINLAKSVLLEDDAVRMRQWMDRYHVRMFSLGERVEEMRTGDAASAGVSQDGRQEKDPSALKRLEADQTASRLGTGLLEILERQRGRPTAAIVIFSDGVTTEGRTLGDAAEVAARRRIPLYLVAMGTDLATRDSKITDLVAEEVAFVNDSLQFDAQLTSSGYEGRSAVVRLLDEDSEQVLAEKTVELPKAGESLQVRLVHRPTRQGEWHYAVEVQPQADELHVANNRQRRAVRVHEQTIRVLYVEGAPSYEFRTLKTFLSRQRKTDLPGEAAIDLHTVLQEGDAEYVLTDATAQRAFPASREALFDYDVVLFGDCNPELFSASTLNHLREFVKERGGGLLFLSGPRYLPVEYRESPLRELFPVRLEAVSIPAPQVNLTEAFIVAPSAIGVRSPMLQLGENASDSAAAWARLPGLYWMADASDLSPGAMTLLEHPTKVTGKGQRLPVVCMQYVGAGSVVMHLTDETWRWSRDERGPQNYERYWEQVIRYLARGKLRGVDRVELSVDRPEGYPLGEPVRVQARFLNQSAAPTEDRAVSVVIQDEAGSRRSVSLYRDGTVRGLFQSSVTSLPSGSYRGWLASPAVEGEPPSVSFLIQPPLGEQSQAGIDSNDLALAARRANGKLFTMGEIDSLTAELPAGQPVRVEALPPRSLWNLWPLPLAFLAVLTSEWVLRRRAGLL